MTIILASQSETGTGSAVSRFLGSRLLEYTYEDCGMAGGMWLMLVDVFCFRIHRGLPMLLGGSGHGSDSGSS